jgi:cysteine desulfurase family protein (TIGR01976 family)
VLTYDLARALAKDWGPGDEVVVTRLDHDANVRPWVQAAASRGATVRWVDFDGSTAELAVSAVTAALSERTRLVAVTAASNLVGTRPDVPAIASAVHAGRALLYVDGVHLTPHSFVDLESLGADFYVCSPYKFLGPHLGLLAADPALLSTVRPDKLLPASDGVPERFEQGTLPYELLAGTTAAVDFLASLVPGTGSRSGSGSGSGSRRERLAVSMAALEEHECGLSSRVESALAALPGVTLHGSPDRRRTPTVLFSVDGHSPRAVYEALAKHDVNAPAGTFYAPECARTLGLGEAGATRAGIAPYTSRADVDRLVEAVTALL